MDSTGIGVLVAFAHKAFEAGIAFHVTNPQRNVARVFTLLDVADKLGVRESD
ncbi:STAS domain-containing protein [uncultured Olegusella sp.]|uniref:STAS domain-containing protein n=1 Tax=uncultured Olegusella sp. TaxID=1979846 RepID=UPI00260A91AE|nr:STAS domain-containing protein [uncultured Olegusella sp.]